MSFELLNRMGFPWDLGYESWPKNRAPGLPVDESRIILRLLVFTQYKRVTNVRRDAPIR